MQLFRGHRNRWRKRIKTIEIDNPQELLPYLYWIEKQPLRFLLPVEMIRMQGAFPYDNHHPFVAALQAGQDSLATFYERFVPETLVAMYSLAECGRNGEKLPPWELPWVMRHRRTPPSGERRLDSRHGVSFYGPASAQKIEMEYTRLCDSTRSIQKHGYLPDRYGDIEGHVMTDGRDTRFFVRGGKHRAAVLVYLGYRRIPVCLRRTWPLVIDSRTSTDWPLVVNGSIDINLANDILGVYLEGHRI